MEKTHSFIIADSSALISLAIVSDSNHVLAKTYMQQTAQAGRSIIVPSEVFAETVNILGKKFGHKQALEAVQIFSDTAVFLIRPTSDLIRSMGLDMFGGVETSVSYTDCLVMAMAEQLSTVDIFGFDEIFSKRGFALPGKQKQRA
jgi:predicted nucleic acid-binding protein